MKYTFRTNRLLYLRLTGIVTVAAFLGGCQSSALPPPVKIEFRDSLLGIGKVVRITNDSNHHLYNVNVVGRNFQQGSSASVRATDHLSPHLTVEVGWMEFESWTPRSGETIEVRCVDYVMPRVAVIP
jgi:hypothetical protein